MTEPNWKARALQAEGERDDLTKALTGLTRGGSEFFTRAGDGFKADIAACVGWVRQARENDHNHIVREIVARKAAEARVEVLKGALEPFAAKLVDIGKDESDEDTFREMSPANRYAPTITVGHFRAARQALQEPTL